MLGHKKCSENVFKCLINASKNKKIVQNFNYKAKEVEIIDKISLRN